MLTASFTEFRNSATKYFDKVAKGETLQILKHGRPVAVISPPVSKDQEYWSHRKPLFDMKGKKGASSLVVEMRRERRT